MYSKKQEAFLHNIECIDQVEVFRSGPANFGGDNNIESQRHSQDVNREMKQARLTYSSSPYSGLGIQRGSSCQLGPYGEHPGSWHRKGSHGGSKGLSHPCYT
jgi:hypothetical protein